MSQLGNIKESFGKSFSIAVANTSSANISYNANLPKNTIIVSAQHNEENEDIVGTALFVTDNTGAPILELYI